MRTVTRSLLRLTLLFAFAKITQYGVMHIDGSTTAVGFVAFLVGLVLWADPAAWASEWACPHRSGVAPLSNHLRQDRPAGGVGNNTHSRPRVTFRLGVGTSIAQLLAAEELRVSSVRRADIQHRFDQQFR